MNVRAPHLPSTGATGGVALLPASPVDNLGTAKGFALALLIAIPFWAAVAAIVWWRWPA